MQWHILDTDGQPQPLSEPQITALVHQGTITPQTMMWAEGMTDWQPAATARPDLFAASRAPMPPPMPQPISPSGPARKPEKKKGSFFGCLVKIGLALVVLSIVFSLLPKSKIVRSPGYDALLKAEESLKGATTRGSGDTPAEQKAAAAMAETAQALRDAGIGKKSGSTGRGFSGLARKAAAGMDADGFTAVCTIKGDTAVFLVHVPDLRKFTAEAKDSMAAMAWFSASLAWQELAEPRPERICVGIKGIIAYDRVMEGKRQPIDLDDDLTDVMMRRGIQTTTTGSTECQQKLATYFEPAGVKPANPEPAK